MIFFVCVVTWAFFIFVKVTMAVHVASVHRYQVIYKLKQRCLLRVCSGISGLSFSVKSANIADTNTMRIMAMFLAMAASSRDRPSQFYCAIEVYNIVIAYAGETSLAMPTIDIGRVEVLAGLGGRTVYYDLIDISHIRLAVTTAAARSWIFYTGVLAQPSGHTSTSAKIQIFALRSKGEPRAELVRS